MRGTSAAQLLWSPAEADQCASIMRCTSEADALRFHPCGGSWHNGHIGTRTSFCCRSGQWWVSWAKCAVQKDLWQPPHTSGKKSSRRQCAQGAPIQSIDPVPWPAWLIPSPTRRSRRVAKKCYHVASAELWSRSNQPSNAAEDECSVWLCTTCGGCFIRFLLSF